MAMTQLALLFLGTLAAILSGAGLFGPFADDATNVVMSFVGAIVWGAFGLSAFDVIVHSTAYSSKSEPIMPLVFVGFGFSIVVGLFALLQLLMLVRGETQETTSEGLMP